MKDLSMKVSLCFSAQRACHRHLRLSHALRNDARLVGWSAALLTHGVRRDRRGLGGGQNGDALGIPLGDQK